MEVELSAKCNSKRGELQGAVRADIGIGQGLLFRIQSLELRIESLQLRIQNLKLRIWSLECEGLEYKV